MRPGSPEIDPLLTRREISAMFRVRPATVSRWFREGKLTVVRTLGGHGRARESEVLALLGVAPLDPKFEGIGWLWPDGASGEARSARRKLEGAGIDVVGKLTALSAFGLEDRGFRPAQVEQIRIALAAKGLALRGDVLVGKVA